VNKYRQAHNADTLVRSGCQAKLDELPRTVPTGAAWQLRRYDLDLATSTSSSPTYRDERRRPTATERGGSRTQPDRICCVRQDRRALRRQV